MKNIKIFVLFKILGMLLHAQTGEISGRVFNAKQEPLWGSNVYLTGTIYGASTDSAGYFNITGIPVGKYSVVSDYIGYRSRQYTLQSQIQNNN